MANKQPKLAKITPKNQLKISQNYLKNQLKISQNYLKISPYWPHIGQKISKFSKKLPKLANKQPNQPKLAKMG